MAYTICFDIGGTRIKSGMVANGIIVASKIMDVEDNRLLAPLLFQIEKVVEKYRQENDSYGELIGVGIALPCFVDSKKNKILSHYVKYTDASSIDLNHWAMEKWKVPVALQNDAKAALLGEAHYGAGQDSNNLVMLTFGTGIGSAVMINRKLLNGKNYVAGNLAGHSIINYDGEKCNCGQIGCLEAEASSWSLPLKIKKETRYFSKSDKEKIFSSSLDFRSIFEQESTIPLYQKIKNQCLDVWGMAIINMVLAYNPESIICGGGVMKSHDLIFPHFNKTMDNHGWINSDFVQLKVAKQPEFAAILGMHYMLNNKKY